MPAAVRMALSCDERTCPVCGQTKHRSCFGFAGNDVCNVCRQVGPRVVTAGPSRSPVTVAMLFARTAPTPAELAAVRECVRLMLLPPDREHRTTTRPGPEAAIDRVTTDWVRRIQLGSLALQMVREA